MFYDTPPSSKKILHTGGFFFTKICIALGQVHAIATVLNHRMISIRHKRAHLRGCGWTVRFTILRKRSWSAIEVPGTLSGHSGLIGRNGIEKEMDMPAR